MSKKAVKLGNSVFWDHHQDDKFYMESVSIAIEQFPFAMRQVFLRFADGPAIDASIVDMDRLTAAYLSQPAQDQVAGGTARAQAAGCLRAGRFPGSQPLVD